MEKYVSIEIELGDITYGMIFDVYALKLPEHARELYTELKSSIGEEGAMLQSVLLSTEEAGASPQARVRYKEYASKNFHEASLDLYNELVETMAPEVALLRGIINDALLQAILEYIDDSVD